MTKSRIEWTDEVWNPVTGCTKVSEGCKNCYAERLWPRLAGNPKHAAFGRPFTDVRCHPARLEAPLHWRKPRRVFVNSMSDLFHEDVPVDFIDRMFAVMALCPQHTFQVLTKRPERMREYLSVPTGWRWMDCMREISPHESGNAVFLQTTGLAPSNVWLGVSVEDQATADERIPLLLHTPAAVRFLSVEPMLGLINLRHMDVESAGHEGMYFIDSLTGRNTDMARQCKSVESIDWVIVGGESGPNARPVHPDWVRSLRDQCVDAGVPFFFKQWGEWFPIDAWSPGGAIQLAVLPDGSWCSMHIALPDVGEQRMMMVGKKVAGRILDGRRWDEMPIGYPF